MGVKWGTLREGCRSCLEPCPANSRGTNNSIRPFSPTHTVLYAPLYYCCHAAPRLGGREQRTHVTYTLPRSSAWGERGVDRPVVLIPSMYHSWSRSEGTGCLTWFQLTWLREGFVWHKSYQLASSRRQTALVDIAQGVRQSNHDALWFYSLLWWCSRLDTAISAWMVWTDPALSTVFFPTSFFDERFCSCFPDPPPSNKNWAFAIDMWGFLIKVDISASLSTSSRASTPACCRSDLPSPPPSHKGCWLPCVAHAGHLLPPTLPY